MVEPLFRRLTGVDGMANKKDVGTFETRDIQNRSVTVTVMDDIEISTDLNREMADQPGRYAWYGALHEQALYRQKKAKYLVHCKQEDLDKLIRERSARTRKDEDKKLTEGAIKAEINRDPEMREAFKKYMAASREAGLLKVLREAFDQRASMLQSIGANRRAEFEQGELKTLKQKAKAVTRRLAQGADETEEP